MSLCNLFKRKQTYHVSWRVRTLYPNYKERDAAGLNVYRSERQFTTLKATSDTDALKRAEAEFGGSEGSSYWYASRIRDKFKAWKAKR